ncbi:MAG TPA: helix-turn-helix transcriptional regulator [Pyrinomonadaceae bacterium]|nr:helix-turn-helix transcriptional regulator [Pyrinomonadaceae bacterium]
MRRRKERGLTQAQMAKRLGVSQPVVSDYERGGLRLHGELILKVAEILDVSANELLGLDTKAAPKKRGPQSQLEKQMAAIATLPRKEQQQLWPWSKPSSHSTPHREIHSRFDFN